MTAADRHAPLSPASLRVTLPPPCADLATAVSGWFGDAWLDMYGRPAERIGRQPPNSLGWLEAPAPGTEARLVVCDGEPIGFLALRCEAERLTLTALAIAPARRNRGLGAEAVYAAESLVPAGGPCQALVPIGNGLAIYFWLRIGYRPLFAARHGLAGVTVLERRPPVSGAPAAGSAAR